MTGDEGRVGVVVGFDGSAHAMQALDWALDEAEWRSVPVTLCHVWDWPYDKPDQTGMRSLRTAAEHVLAHGVTCARERTSGVRVNSELCEGAAAQRLVELSVQADLMVVGSRGLGRFARLVAGSVAERVLARSQCPVIVVRGGGALPRPEPVRPVAVGVDDSRTAEGTLDFAVREAQLRHSPLQVVHATGEPGLSKASGLNVAFGHERLERMAARLVERHPDVEIRPELVEAPVRDALLGAAKDAGLVVVGVPSRGRPLVGTIGQWLLHHATCPVAVVPKAGR